MPKKRRHDVKISVFSIKCGLIRKIEFSCHIFTIREPFSDEIVFINTNADKAVIDFEKLKKLPEMVTESVDHEEIVKTKPENGSLSPEEKKVEKIPCPVCGKLFNKWFDIKRHMSTHTGEKPFTVKTLLEKFSIFGKLFG